MQNNSSQFTDEELMVRYQGGDEEAFKELYRRHSPKVYGFIGSRVKDPGIRDDIFQAVFMKLHQARAHYDSSFPFIPWLFTVTKSVLINNVRKQNRRLEDLNELALEKAQVPQTEEQNLKLPKLAGLNEMQQKAMELRYGAEEFSFEQIAERLSTSPANVRQLISRAIKKLRSAK